jgi:hypothetical protein
MKIPDDLTILWSDDNSGNIQRLPIPSEVSREGNAGVYYHFDYVGSPRNYKWINTIQLSKTWEQMHLAWAKNATEIWIVNVGDLKSLVSPPSIGTISRVSLQGHRNCPSLISSIWPMICPRSRPRRAPIPG